MNFDFPSSAPAPLLPNRSADLQAGNPFAPANSTAEIPNIDASARASYDSLFHQCVGVAGGSFAGAQARPFFAKSGLPNNVLAQIWGLADMDKNGALDREEFAIAFHLCQAVRKGATLPAQLPRHLVPQSKLMYYQNAATKESEWVSLGGDSQGFGATFNASTTSNSYHTANQALFAPTTPQQTPPSHSLQPTPIRPQNTGQQQQQQQQQQSSFSYSSQPSLPPPQPLYSSASGSNLAQPSYNASPSLQQSSFPSASPSLQQSYAASPSLQQSAYPSSSPSLQQSYPSASPSLYSSGSASNLAQQHVFPASPPPPLTQQHAFPASPPPPLTAQQSAQYGNLFSPSQAQPANAQPKVDMFSAPPANNFFDPPKNRPQSAVDFPSSGSSSSSLSQQAHRPRATTNDFFSPAPPPASDFFSSSLPSSSSYPSQPVQRQASTVANPFGAPAPSSNDFFSAPLSSPAPPSNFFSTPSAQPQPPAQRAQSQQDFFSQPQGYTQQNFAQQNTQHHSQQSYSQQSSTQGFFTQPAQGAQHNPYNQQPKQADPFAQSKPADPFAQDPFAAPARAPAQQGGGYNAANPFGQASSDPFGSGASVGSSGLVFIPPEHQVKTREMDASNTYALGPGTSFDQRIALSADLAGAMKKVREKNNVQ